MLKDISPELTNRLISALKSAFCYVPELKEITEDEYVENTQAIRTEVTEIRNTLIALGIEPDELYAEMNPQIKSNTSKETTKFIKDLKKEISSN